MGSFKQSELLCVSFSQLAEAYNFPGVGQKKEVSVKNRNEFHFTRSFKHSSNIGVLTGAHQFLLEITEFRNVTRNRAHRCRSLMSDRHTRPSHIRVRIIKLISRRIRNDIHTRDTWKNRKLFHEPRACRSFQSKIPRIHDWTETKRRGSKILISLRFHKYRSF